MICSAPDTADAAALMNSHLEVISQWTTANRTRLNLSKSFVMWFRVPGQHRTPYFPEVLVGNTPLTVVSKQKYLGLIFDDALSWSHQVSKVCRSMSYYLYLLNKHKHVFKMNLLTLLTESLVFSHLLYSLPVWGPSLNNSHINRLRLLQTQAVCVCKDLHKYDHISHHFHSLHWLLIGCLIQYRSLYSMHHQFFHPQHTLLVLPMSFGRPHHYDTRTTQLLAQPPRCRLSFTQRLFQI